MLRELGADGLEGAATEGIGHALVTTASAKGIGVAAPTASAEWISVAATTASAEWISVAATGTKGIFLGRTEGVVSNTLCWSLCWIGFDGCSFYALLRFSVETRVGKLAPSDRMH